MGSKGRRTLLALACLGAIHFGCGPVLSYYYVSAPERLPGGVAGTMHASGDAELRLQDLKLTLSALDATPHGSLEFVFGVPIHHQEDPKPIPSLMMLFEFEPKLLGLSFNPMEVAVRTPDGGLVHPSGYVGPGELHFRFKTFPRERRCLRGTIGFWEEEIELSKQMEARFHPLPVKSTCFVLAFDTQVVPPSGVELIVEGIAHGVQRIQVPGLRFSRREAKSGAVDIRPPALN